MIGRSIGAAVEGFQVVGTVEVRQRNSREIEILAERALETIPDAFKRHLGPLVIRVEEFPDEETEAAMELESPFDILGLYRGVALPHQSVSHPRSGIDMVFLYRRPILDYWCETGSGVIYARRRR